MNAMTKHPPAPVDPIAAAIAKYRGDMVLPDLTPAAPDDLLIAHMERTNFTVVTQMETRARQAYDHARTRRMAPVATLDAQLVEIVQKMRNARSKDTKPGSRSAASWQSQMAVVRICMDAIGQFTDWSASWEKMSDAERGDAVVKAEASLRARQYHVVAAPSVFSPAAFLTSLAPRNITVAPLAGGELLVTGSSRLTPHERAMIAAQKATIWQAFGAEVF